MESLAKHAQENVDVVLVGTRADMEAEREVTTDEAQAFAEKHNMRLFEVSVKNSDVSAPFLSLASMVHSRCG